QFRDARLAPEARRVDEAQLAPAPFEIRGDGITREARFRPGQETFLAEQRVDQRRLARIGTPDDGDPDGARVGIFGFDQLVGSLTLHCRCPIYKSKCHQHLRNELEDALAMLSRDRVRLAEPKLEAFVDAV